MTDKINWRSRIVKYGKVRAGEITPHPNNPRKHPQLQREAVAASFDELGQIAPILININNGYLIDGEERSWLALGQGEDVEVDAIWVDLSEEEHNKALVYFDATGDLATYDAERLNELLADVNSDNSVIQQMIDGLKDIAIRDVPDETIIDDDSTVIDRAGELQQKWQVKLGDKWQAGKHMVYCGDAKDFTQLKPDMFFCDPPFEMNYQCQADILNNLNARQIVWMSSISASYQLLKYITRKDYRWTVFWDGVLAMSVPNKYRPIVSVDLLMTFGGDGLFNNEDAIAQFGCTEKQVPHYLRIVRPVPNQRETAWQKPLNLIQGFVELLSNRGDIVADLFLSSGTTLIACEQSGRTCIGVELEPKFVAVTLERAELAGLEVHRVQQ